MIIILLLILSIILQLIAAYVAFRLIRISRGPVAWLLISIAMLFLAARHSMELANLLESYDHLIILDMLGYLFGVLISILLTISVMLIARVLHSYKKTEDIRKISEQRFRTLFNSTTDIIFAFDFRGNIIETNQTASEILGYTKTELLTKNINQIVSSRYTDIFLSDILENLNESGKYIIEAEYLSKDGGLIPVEINARFLNFAAEKYLICIAREITERKEMQKRILKTMIDTEERERKRFAKDLHDGLGPLLSTVKLYVNELEAESISEKEKKEYIQYTNELVDEAVGSIRTISNNITPNIISNYGLIRSLESFISKINKTQQVAIHFKTIDLEEKFDSTLELVMYRIVTELINNTIKHAGAKNIHIVLEMLNRKLILTYRDDGQGFDIDKVLQEKKGGMGLRNIISRVNSINGSYDFNREIKNGTEIRIKLDVTSAS